MVYKLEYVNNGEYPTLPSITPTKEGYTFKGWDYDGKPITKNTEINALWQDNTPVKYNVDWWDETNEEFNFMTLLAVFSHVLYDKLGHTINAFSTPKTYYYLQDLYNIAIDEWYGSPLFNTEIYEEVYDEIHGGNDEYEKMGKNAMILWLMAMALSELVPSQSDTSINKQNAQDATNYQTEFFKIAYNIVCTTKMERDGFGNQIPLYKGYTPRSDLFIVRLVASTIYARNRRKYQDDIATMRTELKSEAIPTNGASWGKCWKDDEGVDDKICSDEFSQKIGYCVNFTDIFPPAPGPYTTGIKYCPECGNTATRIYPWDKGQPINQFDLTASFNDSEITNLEQEIKQKEQEIESITESFNTLQIQYNEGTVDESHYIAESNNLYNMKNSLYKQIESLREDISDLITEKLPSQGNVEDDYGNYLVDKYIYDKVVSEYNLDNKEHIERTVQAIADDNEALTHLFRNKVYYTYDESNPYGSFKPAESGHYFSGTFNEEVTGKDLSGLVNNQAFVDLFDNVREAGAKARKVYLNFFYGRRRPGQGLDECNEDGGTAKYACGSGKENKNYLTDTSIMYLAEGATRYDYNNNQYFIDKNGNGVLDSGEEVSTTTSRCQPFAASSYPSGHNSSLWAEALILMEMFPERYVEIYKAAYSYGVSRTIVRAHWNSDTIYGRLIATASVPLMHAFDNFETKYAAAKNVIFNRGNNQR